MFAKQLRSRTTKYLLQSASFNADFWNFYVAMLGATLPGDVPNIVPVLVEDEGRVGLGDPPGALFDLMLELVPSPASVAEGDEDLCRPSLVADVLQDRDARRNRKAIRDGDGLRPTVIGTMDHEADFRLDRPARKDAHAARNIAVLLAERLENTGERLLSDRLVDDDPDGAAGTVFNDQDDCALEARVAHPGRGDQQLAGERGLSGRFVRPKRRPEEGRLQDERRDDKAETTQPDRGHVSPARLRGGSRIPRARCSPKERCSETGSQLVSGSLMAHSLRTTSDPRGGTTGSIRPFNSSPAEYQA